MFNYKVVRDFSNTWGVKLKNIGNIKILFVEDKLDDVDTALKEIKKVSPSVEYSVISDINKLQYHVKQFEPDIIIMDYSVSISIEKNILLDLIDELKSNFLHLPIIFLSNENSEQVAVDCMNLGAYDYVVKSRIKRLPFVVSEAINKGKLLHERENMYKSMFKKSKLPMLLLDLNSDLKILDFNEAAQKFYGYSDEEFYSMTIFNLNILPREEVIKYADKAKQESQSYFNFQHKIKSGEIKFVNVYSGPVCFSGKTCLLSTIIDVSEQKKLEMKNKKLEEQLEFLNRIESIGRLAAGIAHDFNNMLTPIMAFSDVGDSITDDIVVQGYFRQIKNTAEKASKLTRQLLSLARKQALYLENIKFDDFMNESFTMLKRLTTEDLDFVLELEDDLPYVKMDSGQFIQVLINLVVNAIYALKNVKDKKLHITVYTKLFQDDDLTEYADLKKGKYVVVNVSDNGCGIDRENLKKIFDPFFTTKNSDGGNGLGLSISLGIVQQHNGAIHVYSELGVGTTFKVYLPCDGDSDESILPEKHKEKFKGCDYNIMLVEDNEFVLESIRIGLSKYGCRIFISTDPEEALKKFLSGEFKCDLLITDVVMPKYNGGELYKMMKKVKDDLKVVFISGYASTMVEDILAIDKGVSFMQKPFSISELVSLINSLMREQK
ncbi:MAG: response regulator [Calditerrivibrio sp.]|nr:response regulator [Calditerrivibrio sp.]